MERASTDRERLQTAKHHAGPRPADDGRVRVHANARFISEEAARAEYLSDTDIVQLVSVALEDAMSALGEADPENYIRLRAYEARVGMREMLSAFPREKSRDPKVLRDYRRGIMFQNLVIDLSLDLVASIRRYSKVYEREIPLRSA